MAAVVVGLVIAVVACGGSSPSTTHTSIAAFAEYGLTGYGATTAARRAHHTAAQPAHATDWSIQGLDQPAISLGGLVAVSCVSKTRCMAVGNAAGRALAERWDGSAWWVLSVSVPAGSSSFAGVSCTSAVSCVAVGSVAVPPSSATVPLVERWNGSMWAVQRTPGLGRSSSSALAGVSCTSARVCVAVGSITAPRASGLVERWNGVRWTMQVIPRPRGSSGVSLRAVSCVPAGACTAVGESIGRQLSDGDQGGSALERSLVRRDHTDRGVLSFTE
jgi:hypothetical protein